MKYWALRLVSVLLLVSTNTSFAYEVDTHEDLSENAALVSVLAKDSSLLSHLGLQQLPLDSGDQQFPNSQREPRSIVQLIRNGSNFEDNNPRALAHFYNPRTGRPIIGLGLPSPDWALEDTGPQSLLLLHQQEDSFADTRQFFLNALTKETLPERHENWGRTFQGLGQVIHHLQDMAQPQHVRSDAHLKVTDNGTLFIENPSLYEILTNRADVRSTLPYTGYDAVYGSGDPIPFNSPRQFWHTEDGLGIADYTNRGFVSAGTNFDKYDPVQYPLPEIGAEWAEDKTDLCLELSLQNHVPLPTGPDGQALPCLMTFISTYVGDAYRPSANALNKRTSTHSLFTADLKAFNEDGIQSYTLNRFNFQDAYQFLIPRAIGYSAGLINFFFRGGINLVPDPNTANPGGYLLKNLGEEEISGTFPGCNCSLM